MTEDVIKEHSRLNREKHFRTDAKQMVDMLFDGGILKDGITRDDMNGIEDLINYLLQAKFDIQWRASELFNEIKNRKFSETNTQ